MLVDVRSRFTADRLEAMTAIDGSMKEMSALAFSYYEDFNRQFDEEQLK